jgi:hypothetical protein
LAQGIEISGDVGFEARARVEPREYRGAHEGVFGTLL